MKIPLLEYRAAPRKRAVVCVAVGILLLLSVGYGALDFFIMGKKSPACVIDIDGTIAHRDGSPLPGSVETLKWLDGCGLKIFYLSRRPSSRFPAVKQWLQNSGFPLGEELVLKENARELPLHYKARVIRKIQENYLVLFGIGDKRKDIRAYQECGIVAVDVAVGWRRLQRLIENILKAEGSAEKGRLGRQ